jgi:hypothetical protein
MCTALVLAVWLTIAGPGRADERTEALKIVDAAIQAAGGAAKLEKLRTIRVKGKGSIHEGAKEVAFIAEGTMQGSDHFRFDLDVDFKGEAVKLLLGLSGNKGWRKVQERVFETPTAAVPLFKGPLHAFRMAEMLTALKDKDIKLSPLGEIKINTRSAVGIKISKKDHPDVDLYFDKEMHLPIRCELRLNDPETGQEVVAAWLFSGFKEMDGVQHATKLVLNRDGNKMMEIEISEVKPEEKVDDDTFAKP